MDIGGHRFLLEGRPHHAVGGRDTLPLQGAPSYDDRKLGRHHDLEPGGPDPETCDEVMLKRHRVSPHLLEPAFLRLPDQPEPEHAQGHGPQADAGGRVLVPEVDGAQAARGQPGELLHQPFRGASCTRCSSRATPRSCGGRHPSQISAPTGARQRVKGLSITRGAEETRFLKLLPKKQDSSKVETSLIEEFWYPQVRAPASCGRPWSATASAPACA